jgi:hypothetical protein
VLAFQTSIVIIGGGLTATPLCRLIEREDMDFYNDPKKVDEYEKMCEEYDCSDLYRILANNLSLNSTLLELGCGPGNDIKTLKNKYKITGSDLSDEFINRCEKRFPELTFVKLDANKVLHHFKTKELEKSLKRQQSVIKSNGIFAHTFWLGDKEFTMEGMLFVFHNRAKLLALVSKYFTILETYDYKEFEEGDSIFIVAKNNKSA